MTKPAARQISSWLAARRLLVGDGGMGSLLMAAGLPPGGCPEIWNLERPEVIEKIMADYRAAGAELLETNSFGGSPKKLSAYGLERQCEALNRAAAQIGRRAAGDDALVVGSIGPTGELLEPYGLLAADAARDGFAQQAAALAAGGADLLCIETMTDLAEALLAIEGAARTKLPVIATLTFDATPRGPFTIMGNAATEVTKRVTDAGVFALGTNCGTGPETMLAFVRALRSATRLPICVQPNAGLPEVVGGQTIYPQSPQAMATYVEAMVDAGASIIGGCCGTTPDHVRAFGAEVRRLRERAGAVAAPASA